MDETLPLVLAAGAGLLLGMAFYGGLWWTVRKGLSSGQPALWFFGSLMLRTGFVLAGIYVVGGDDWARLLLCLLGFAVARPIVTRLAPALAARQNRRVQVASYAP